jgi:hypothetical protein
MSLQARHKTLIAKYVDSTFSNEGVFNVVNPLFAHFRQLVLGLPGCDDLTEGDVLNIAADILYKVQHERAGRPLEQCREQATTDLIQFVEQLPKPYTICFGLPKLKGLPDFRIALSDRIELRGSGQPQTPINKIAAVLMQQPEADSAEVVLRISAKGYVPGWSSRSQATADAIALAKQSLFLLLLVDAFKLDGWPKARGRAEAIDEPAQRTLPIAISGQLSERLGSLSLNEDQLQVLDDSRDPSRPISLLFAQFRKAETPEEKLRALAPKLEFIKNFYSQAGAMGFGQICTAIEWYQDSHLADDESMAFISACIGLESILGEDEQAKGLSEISRRLGDRYAFMLGKDRSERSRLAQDFCQVTDLRGRLVHARTARLKIRDRHHLDVVRDMLWKTITHEMQPLLRRSA